MQIVSEEDNLHEMSNPIFWENKKNLIYLSSAESAHHMISVISKKKTKEVFRFFFLFIAPNIKRGFFVFFLIWVLRPFQEYFTYIEPIVHRRWAKTGEPGEKPPDHP